MLIPLIWMSAWAAAGPVLERPPSQALAAKIQKGIRYGACFKRSRPLRQQFSYRAWTEGRVQHVDTGKVIFQISEANGSYRKPGLILKYIANPNIDDEDFNFIAGIYDVRRQRILSQGCYSNLRR
jgi:hypothetical protein